MSLFNFHQDRPFPGGFPADAWASNPVFARTTPTSGSTPEFDQRGLAHHFSHGNGLGIRDATWTPTPAGGIASTPESNQAVHTHFVVDYFQRQPYDVLKEELTWNVNFSRVLGTGGSAPTHHLGLSAVNRWLRGDDDLAVEIGYQTTHALLSATIAFIGSLITTPVQNNPSSGKRPKKTEAYIRFGRARLQDIWSYQNEDQDGLLPGERLSVVYARRDKKLPRILDPRFQRVLIDRRFEWQVEPVSHIDFMPPVYTYRSDVVEADGGVFKGRELFIGTFLRDLTMQNHGVKDMYNLAHAYVHGSDPAQAFEGYRQLRSIEVQTRQ